MEYWPEVGVGLLGRNHPVVDIDCTDPGLAEKIHKRADEILGLARDEGTSQAISADAHSSARLGSMS